MAAGETGSGKRSSRLAALVGREDLAEVVPLLEWLLPKLSSWAHGKLPRGARSRLETGDLVQEAAVGALQHLPAEKLRSPDALRSYIQESIRNRIVDEVRRAGKVETRDPDAEEHASDPGSSPLDDAIESEDRRRYRCALASLDEEEQMLVVGRVELDLSYHQLALAIGRPSADAARVASRRAILHLAREVGRLRSARA